MRVSRRTALSGLGLGAAAPAFAAAPAAGARFLHGVASGDPAPNGAVLWTRITTDAAGNVPLDLEVSGDAAFSNIAYSERGLAMASRDHTLKIDVASPSLTPGQTYHYRFRAADGALSPAGRFRTLPRGRTESLTLAVASCALWPGGYFNAYRALAQAAPDAVVFLGDYIYEYALESYAPATGLALGRIPEPPRECVTLSDYRTRFAQARADADLQAAHAAAAWICAWDDHELANDATLGGAQNHQTATEGAWAERKAAAIRAFYEWMPIREPKTGEDSFTAWRSFVFGDLARLLMLETRITGKDRQLSFARTTATPESISAFEQALANPARRMISQAQEDWLAAELTASSKAEAWQVLGSSVLMGRFRPVDPRKVMTAAAFARLPISDRRAALASHLPVYLDSWDGYPAARERIYDRLEAARARPIVLSGDTHAFWMNELRREAGGPALGAELGTAAISSVPSGGPRRPDSAESLALFVGQNRDVKAYDPHANGFALLRLTRDRATCEWVSVSTVLERRFETQVTGRFEVRPRAGGGVDITGRSQPSTS